MRRLLPRVLLGLVGAGIGLGMGLGLATTPGPAWPATFCRPINRVIGVAVDRIVTLEPSPTSELPSEGMLLQLRKDIEAALAAAPTAELRAELVNCDTRIQAAGSTSQVDDALSQFDQLARTQLEGCGVRP